MAIAIQPKFPIPDRTKQAIRSTKDQDGVIDIGWCDGVLSDGRAFRAEMWAQDQVSMLTFFFSSIGLEALDAEGMKRFIEQEELLSFRRSGPSYCAAALFIDDGGSAETCSFALSLTGSRSFATAGSAKRKAASLLHWLRREALGRS